MTTSTSLAASAADTVVVLDQGPGMALIPIPTPLTRLNFFDGKFLRAADFQLEQAYGRQLQQVANQAGGAGVVHGFEIAPGSGDSLQLEGGLGIDGDGRVLYLPRAARVDTELLIARSQSAGQVVQAGGAAAGAAVFRLCELAAGSAPVAPVDGISLYVLGISAAQALCGMEDVYHKLCEQACVGDTERPHALDGVVLRAVPLQLASPLPASTAVALGDTHLRSRVASAYFADEARAVASLISAAGLSAAAWCRGAAAAGGAFLPLGVLGRAGGHTVLLDLWTARRERVDGAPRRYWQWRMAMRPMDVYLAQILHFQCQLRDAWQAHPERSDDPCAPLKNTVSEVTALVTELERQYRAASERLAEGDLLRALDTDGRPRWTVGLGLIDHMSSALKKVQGHLTLMPRDRVLIRRGIVELPSAGYLPVAIGSAVTVNEQVRRLMGEGVDLRLCVVRPDHVAHALEEAQHMDRISLLKGLDDPKALEQVDILVPDGLVRESASRIGQGWAVAVREVGTQVVGKAGAGDFKRLVGAEAGVSPAAHTVDFDYVQPSSPYARQVLAGAARSERGGDGSLGFFFAGLAEMNRQDAAYDKVKAWAEARDNNFEQTLWQTVRTMDEQARAPAAAADAAAAAGAAGATAADGAAATAATGLVRTAAGSGSATVDVAGVANRIGALRKLALSHRLRTIERTAARPNNVGARNFPGLKGEADSDHLAVWLALRAQADPFELAEGASTDGALSLTVLQPRAGMRLFLDLDVVGARFTLDSRVAVGTSVALQGSLRGAAIVRGDLGALAEAQRSLPFQAPVLVTAESRAEGRVVRVEIDLAQAFKAGGTLAGLTRLTVAVRAQAAPRAAKLSIGLGTAQIETVLAATLEGDDGVLTAGHPLRSTAEAAIEVLATQESAPDFAAQAGADLFGKPAAAASELTITAQRDWVLFHRRRPIRCAGTAVAPVAETRRYQVFHLRAATEDVAAKARAVVLGGNADRITKAGFAAVAVAGFDGGRSTLNTPTGALLADWDAAQPGPRLRFGAIASQGAAQAEGDALAKARLAALELTLLRGQLDQGIDNAVLPVVPELVPTGWDGAIFFVTVAARTVCHDVYRLRDEATLRRFDSLVQQEGLPASIHRLELQPLAHVEFAADGSTLDAAALQALRTGWGSEGPPTPSGLVYHVTETAEATALAQGRAIAVGLEGSGAEIVARARDDLAQVTACDGVTMLVATPPLTVLFVAANFDGRFFFDREPPLINGLGWVGLTPRDPAKFQDALREVLRAREPASFTVATPTTDGTALAQTVRDRVDRDAREMGYQRLVEQRVARLGTDEAGDLDRLNIPAGSYAAVVYFSDRVGN